MKVLNLVSRYKNGNLNSFAIISTLSVANAVFPFLLLPILTNELEQSEFGMLVIMEAFLALLAPLIHCSLGGLLVEYYRLEKEDFKSYLFNTLLLALPFFLLAMLITNIFAEFFVDIFGANRGWLLILPILCFINVVNQITVVLFQCQKKYGLFGLFLLGPNLLTFIITLILLNNTGLGWESKLYAMLGVASVYSMFSIYIVLRESDKHRFLNLATVKSNLAYTMPLLPHTLMAALYFMSDRLILSNMLGAEAVAIYASGLQLALIMSVLQNSLSKAWSPFVIKYLSKTSDENQLCPVALKKMRKYMFLACFFVVLAALFVSVSIWYLVDILLPPQYQEAKYTGVILVIGFMFLGFYKIFSPILWYFKKTSQLSKVTTVVFVLNIVFNLMFIPQFGIIGASISTLSCLFLQFALTQMYIEQTLKSNLVKA
ncbi:oligosaccharide flippase family protein [Catenovulum maritimum]|uniref:Uncharacterized protein n=1 Tax=Catenovulum maritimum TaxID=1513271 RepID=A0A0J8JJW5_9ALTE|nr:oligosaccharide flippase family protein [Catenovulum maritimum]KMT64741.1 hypothetical protein XM47_12845 [Catenovulum maritimum]